MKTFICIGVLMICIGLVFAKDAEDETMRELLLELRDRLEISRADEGVKCGFGKCPVGIPCLEGPFGPYCKRLEAAEAP